MIAGGDPRPRARWRAPAARRVAADRRRRGMTVTVGLVGGGVVADRLRNVAARPVPVRAARRRRADRRAGDGRPARRGRGPVRRGREPRRVDVGVESGRPRAARARRGGARCRRQHRRRRGGVAGSERPVRPPPGERPRRLRRAARRGPRHGRAGVRPRAPRRPARLGDRLPGRHVDRAPGGQRARAVLVPRAGRGTRLLPRRDARPVVAAPQLPGRPADQRPAVGDAPRPLHGAAADAQPAAP